MIGTTKYVVSSTLRETTWRNFEIVGPYSSGAVQAIKDRVGGGIYVSGSGTLVRALLADGLADEVHLFVFPLTLGHGQRLFADDGRPAKWALAASETYSNGVVYLTYRRDPTPASGI